jgi:hypothetical protein
MIHARRLLNIDTNMSAWFEEKHELMLMTFPSPPKEKQRWKLYFGWLHVFTRTPVGMSGDWHWSEDHFYNFDSRCLNTVFFFLLFRDLLFTVILI